MPYGIALVWILLVGLTASSWFLGIDGEALHFNPATIATAMLVVTFMKIRLVIMNFMEIKDAPAVLRAPFELWCVVVCGTLIYLFVGAGHA